MGKQRFTSDLWQGNGSPRARGLRLHKARLAIDPLQGLPDHKLGIGEAYVHPAQAKQFALSQASRYGRYVERLEAFTSLPTLVAVRRSSNCASDFPPCGSNPIDEVPPDTICRSATDSGGGARRS